MSFLRATNQRIKLAAACDVERPSTLRVLLLAGALLLSGCSEAGAPGGGATDVEELALIPIVEELRIGSVEDPSEGFSRISDVLAAPDGTVLVLEGAAGEVRNYDSDGRLIRTFGGRGEGPGEFERPGTFGLVDDTLSFPRPTSARGGSRVPLEYPFVERRRERWIRYVCRRSASTCRERCWIRSVGV